MACSSPLEAYQSSAGAPLFFGNPNEAERSNYRSVTVACGQCQWCRLERSRQWAIRCMHESQLYEFNVFGTFTVSDERMQEVFPNGSLAYRPFQLFMKKLRKTGRKPRFYMCGEYGEMLGRPHYHACLFNTWFPDMRYWRMSSAGFKLYRSAELESLWPYGNCEIGMVSFESAAYCARYVMKKVNGDLAKTHYERVDSETGEVISRMPEFTRMSLKPGIGAEWYRRYGRDVFPHDYVVVNGVKTAPPKYYKVLLDRDAPDIASELRDDRELRASLRRSDNTVERREVKARVLDAKVKLLKREM